MGDFLSFPGTTFIIGELVLAEVINFNASDFNASENFVCLTAKYRGVVSLESYIYVGSQRCGTHRIILITNFFVAC